jgi:hypothetical protein
MRIIPNQPIDTNSRAELKFFEALKRCFNENPSWRAYHSLNIENHSSKRMGEIDFLILCPYGIFVFEVKGGGIKVKAGKWYTVNKEGTFNIQNPFNQAKSAMFSLQKTLIDRQLLKPSNLIAFASVFPDIAFNTESVEWSKKQILDKYGLLDIETWLNNLIEHSQKKTSNQYGLSQQEIINIDQYLRPEFEQVSNLFHPSRLGLSNSIKLNVEQLDILEGVQDNERFICEGAAGTGKTLLAIELVRRLVSTHDNVLFLCRSSFLKSYLKSVITHENLAVSSIVSLEVDSRRRFVDKYDVVIIDEGQDIYEQHIFDLLNKYLDGGLHHGSWYIFQDSNFQRNLYNEINNDCFELINKLSQETLNLSKNYRNTRHIVNFLQNKLSLPVIEDVDVSGTTVIEKVVSHEKIQHISNIIDNILKDIPQKGSVTFLSPLPYEQSLVSKLPSHFNQQLTRLDDYLMNHFPPVRASFCEIKNFKGLENDYIILVDMPHPSEKISDDEKSQYYVALSRPRIKLFCLWTTDPSEVSLPYNEQSLDLLATASSDDWSEIVSITYLQTEAEELKKMNVNVPICGYELIDDNQVQATAELAWEDKQVAVFTESDDIEVREFKAKNWHCFKAPLSKVQLRDIGDLLQ